MQDRLQNFHALSLDFAALGDAELMQLIAQTPGEKGWGRNHVISLNDRRVFIKRLPLTQREYINKFSLANTFDLPSFIIMDLVRQAWACFESSTLISPQPNPSLPVAAHRCR